MAIQANEAYVTLLLNDTYLPGALVLAQSLRDAGATRKLAVMYTVETVSREVIQELKTVYDYGIPVDRIQNDHPANLHLMSRPDLHSAFTKINLWKLTQFHKIVYLDADILALRAPDELFNLPYTFSAAPDIGWPDIFNTGVMVLTPNLGDFYSLMAMAEHGVSFDGADQGLLNMYFKNDFNRLSFTYNVTPSVHYQYLPAYKHFQTSISMVHFIGQNKPWFVGREISKGETPYDKMVGQWWAVYDRHYHISSRSTTPVPSWENIYLEQQHPAYKQPTQLMQYFVKGEFNPTGEQAQYLWEHDQKEQGQALVFPHSEHRHQYDSSAKHVIQRLNVDEAPQEPQGLPAWSQEPISLSSLEKELPVVPNVHGLGYHQGQSYYRNDQARKVPLSPTQEHAEWQPEHGWAPSQQSHHLHPDYHTFHSDKHSVDQEQTELRSLPLSTDLLNPPEGMHAEARSEQVHGPEKRELGSPSTTVWDASRQPPPLASKPEAENFPEQHYEMSQDVNLFVPPERYPTPPRNMWFEIPKQPPALSTESPPPIFPWEGYQPPATRVFQDRPGPLKQDDSPSDEIPGLPGPHTEPSMTGSSITVETDIPDSPSTPTTVPHSSDIWATFDRSNAWDDDPKIQRYAERLQEKTQPKRSFQASRMAPGQLAINDFRGRWRGMLVTDFPSKDERPSLPVTPAPLHNRLSSWGIGGPGDQESLPAAKGVPSQVDWVCVHGRIWKPDDCLCNLTNVLRYHKDPAAQLRKLAEEQSNVLMRKFKGVAKNEEVKARETPDVLSPQPVKGAVAACMARDILHKSPETDPTLTHGQDIPQPSYSGPGSSWEKGEDIPVNVPSLIPTEEEQDILET